MDDDIRIDVSRAGSTARVTVSGEVDSITASALATGIAEASAEGVTEVVLDCTGLTFIDSAGLSVLVNAHRRLRTGGATLVLEAPPRAALRVFQIAGLDRLLEIR